MPQIVAIRTKDDSCRDAIAVVLSQDAVCLGPDGQPWSGVSLSAPLARSLAERLLGLANEIERPNQAPDTFRTLAQVNSILVFHDGSGQGHRTFTLALDLASRSRAAIQLVGIYGIQQDKFEPSGLAEDYEWQRGWLERLTHIYTQEAISAGIDLRATLVAAGDPQRLCEVFDGNRFDLIVLPRRFSDDNATAEAFSAFQQSLAGAIGSTILFCP